jgi:hypothetical protein
MLIGAFHVLLSTQKFFWAKRAWGIHNGRFLGQNSCFSTKTANLAIKTAVLGSKHLFCHQSSGFGNQNSCFGSQNQKNILERGICHEQQGISSLNWECCL